MPKQKKLPTRLKRTIDWLKPTSAKKGALLFAIAFAVIGGGVMAYRSFASEIRAVYKPPYSLWCLDQPGRCEQIDDNSGDRAKTGSVKAVRLNYNTYYNDELDYSSRAYSKFQMPFPWSAYSLTDLIDTRVCVYMRSNHTGASARFEYTYLSSTRIRLRLDTPVIASTSYYKYCTPFGPIRGGTYNGELYIFNTSSYSSKGDIYIRRFQLETR